MTETEKTQMLDSLKQIVAESNAHLAKDQQDAVDKAIADYDRKFDAMEQRLANLSAGTTSGSGAQASEAAKAFNDYMRKGNICDAMTTGTDSNGGYLVPTEQAKEIMTLATNGNPMRTSADVKVISGESYPLLVRTGKASASLVGETDARTNTDTPTYAEIRITPYEIYANPPVSQTLLDDAAFNVEAEINAAVGEAFAEKENNLFYNGTGTSQPLGILAATTVADASWTWGKVGLIETGTASAIKLDDLVDLQDSLKSKYAAGAEWHGTKKTFTMLRKIKQGASGADKPLLWTPEIVGGQLYNTLNGARYVEASEMPDVADGALALAYGNFKAAYVIVDRIGIRILRDPYTNKPYVNFYITKRVGGGIKNFEAYKLLKIKATA